MSANTQPVIGRRHLSLLAFTFVVAAGGALLAAAPAASPAPAAPAAHNDWPTYLADQARTSASDVLVGPLVSPRWTHVLSGFIASEPVLANNRVYVGAWDGYLYALDAFDGHELWRTFLGTYQIKPGCPGAKFNLGITTAPTFDPGSNLLYVSAMSATVVMTDDMSYRFDTGPYLYALDVYSGTIQWQQILSANSDDYAWSSPLIANGHAYVGVASQGDCPLTPGQLVAVDLASPHTSQSVSMAPDSLTVYPNALVTSPNPPTSTLLADGTNYRFTATATIAFIAPLSAAIYIHLRGMPNTLYQPELRVMNSAIPCEPAPLLSFVQFLDAPKFSDVNGEVTFSRTVGLDTAAVNDDKHVLVVDSLVPCSKFVAGVGGGIWSSPTYDAMAHRVYVTTGTPTPPCVPQAMCTGAAATVGPRSAAVVALNADTLAVDWSWQVPFRDQALDADFGATPALCSADISKRMLGAANKNGVFYAFDTEVPGSPVWQRTLARGGGGPEVGEGSISSAACAGGVFYVGAGRSPDDAVVCAGFTGQVWALYAASGTSRWADPHCTSLVMGPVTAAGGMVMYGANCRALGCGRRIEMLDQAAGAVRYQGTPAQLAGLGDMVSGIAVVDGLMVSGDSLLRPGVPVTDTAAFFPLTGTVRALNALAGTYLPVIMR